MHFKWTCVQHFFVPLVSLSLSLSEELKSLHCCSCVSYCCCCRAFCVDSSTSCLQHDAGLAKNHKKQQLKYTHTQHTHTPIDICAYIAICDRMSGVKCDICWHCQQNEQNVFSVLQMKCDSCELKITTIAVK